MSGAAASVVAGVLMMNKGKMFSFNEEQIHPKSAIILKKNKHFKNKMAFESFVVNEKGDYEVLIKKEVLKPFWLFPFFKRKVVTSETLVFKNLRFELVCDVAENQNNYLEYSFYTKKSRNKIDYSRPSLFKLHIKKS